jgi:DNA-directed RNA polymerase subunit E'/Rpb7
MSSQLYSTAILSKDFEFKFTELDDLQIDDFEENLKQYILEKIKKEVEEKCIEDGYVKKNSVKIVSLSCGLFNADKVKYTITYECLICLPAEGMQIRCVTKSISNGGIRAVIAGEDVSPIVAFIARETTDIDLSKYKEGDEFDAVVFGVQYELNDTFVSVLAIILNK